jgi:Sec-independent protein secretion pathway component TatC
MALRDIFKFRELPESETSKPFLEHLEDLRWTIVKMAITLIAAMIICFAFRGTLVRVMQAPLHEIDQNLGVLRALGITDSIVISFHRVLRRYRHLLSLLLFLSPNLFFQRDGGGENPVPGHRRSPLSY